MRNRRLAFPLVLVAMMLASPAAHAEPVSEETTAAARREYVAATEHVKDARWGEALAAFERSQALRSHSLTTYNIGACERALGRYTRAQASLRHALEQNEASGGKELPASFAAEAKNWLDEIDRTLAHVQITIAPEDAELVVDGHPVARTATAGVFVAAVESARRSTGGDAVTSPGPSLTLLLDPGAHLFSVAKQGFSGAVVTRTYGAGERAPLALDLRRLPATIRVSTNQPDAAVMVGGIDVGVAPVEISRPTGTYPVMVQKRGYVSYAATVVVKPGEEANLRAVLVEESSPLYKKTWFWTIAAGVVAGAVTVTYLVTRPDPQRPSADGGGLGWVVNVPAMSR